MRPLRSHPITTALVLVGVALVGAGAVQYATAGSMAIGSSSSAPLPETFSFTGAVLVDARRGIALAVMTAGAILLSATAGHAVGHRRGASVAPPQRP